MLIINKVYTRIYHKILSPTQEYNCTRSKWHLNTYILEYSELKQNKICPNKNLPKFDSGIENSWIGPPNCLAFLDLEKRLLARVYLAKLFLSAFELPSQAFLTDLSIKQKNLVNFDSSVLCFRIITRLVSKQFVTKFFQRAT